MTALWNEYKLDNRTVKDLRKRIKELSLSYTPEWNFDEEHPDIGSVIGLIFSNQAAENIKKLNMALDNYRTEFVNMLGISLLPAHPAGATVIMKLIRDTVYGVDVPKGTKLLGSREAEEERLVFETKHNVHITGAKLKEVLMVSGKYGKIFSYYGEAKKTEIIPRGLYESSGKNIGTEVLSEKPGLIPLFDYSGEGIEQNGLLLYHKSIFDTREDAVQIRFTPGNPNFDLCKDFSDVSRYTFHYYTEKGLVPFEQVIGMADSIILKKEKESAKLTIGNEEYGMIYLKALDTVKETLEVKDITISSKGTPIPPSFVYDGRSELDCSGFEPFGEELSLYDECYIGGDKVFSKQDALITLSFELSHKEKLVGLTPRQEEDDLKPIKRKPKALIHDVIVSTAVQAVSLEYFNGTGWRRLICTTDWQTVFEAEHKGRIEIQFNCPADWKPLPTGGYLERCLRFQILRADNCYMRPCSHIYPVMKNVELSYSYEENWKQPDLIQRIHGTKLSEVTQALKTGANFAAFYPFSYEENALLLGFDQKFNGAPISLYFSTEERKAYPRRKLRYEYSTIKGFEPLKVIDHTEALSKSGNLLFIPPADCHEREIEGVSGYWLKIVEEEGTSQTETGGQDSSPPQIIQDILINAVEVHNVETLTEEEFFIDVPSPYMSFPISSVNLLRTEVYVNEKNNLSPMAIQQMLLENPETVKATYNYQGEMKEFFVLWEEVAGFESSLPTDRHYRLDRMNNRIHFGDGVKLRIPSETAGVAFTVTAYSSQGSAGNVGKGAINESMTNLMFIGDIYNPDAAYGGSNMEDTDHALLRGAGLISSKNRLVSERDYIREMKSFSSQIDKVKCIIGKAADGTVNENIISFAILMIDFREGSYSFHKIKDRLKEHLVNKCEMTFDKENILLSEPVFVSISLDVWVEVHHTDDAFDIQNQLQERITDYLNPISRHGYNGWDIGELPKESQIKMMLHSIKCKGVIKHFVISAKYTDSLGEHETDLKVLSPNPFAVCKNGDHRIHLLLPK